MTLSVKITSRILKEVISRGRERSALSLIAGALSGGIAIMPHYASALNIYDGSDYGNNLEISLSTTLSYAGIVRTNNPSARLTGISNQNGSEGDIDQAHGSVSNAFEVLPILDIKDGDYGAHFSGDAFLNPNYLGTNQNDQPNTLNPISVRKNTDYTSATRNVEGENAQLLDAFVYGTERFGKDDSQSLTLKVGRQTLIWGQSLFLTNNGIAAGMAPIDVITADNTPNAETQQVILPVGQVVATYQPNDLVTIQGYYQFEWKPDELEGVGGFFSSTDILDAGGQSLYLAPGYRVLRTKNITPPISNGQFGASTQLTLGNYDFGFYGLRFDAKTPDIYLASPRAQSYSVVYPRDIWIEGTAFSTTIGAANVAAEVSFRQHMDLVTGANISATENVNSDPAYPVGDTWAGQISTIYLSPGLPLDPDGLSISGEVGFNHVLAVTANNQALLSTLHRSSTAADMEVVVSPTYDRVLPELNLSFPVGLTYNLYGRSMVDSTENQGTGAMNFGVNANYKVVWTASFTFHDNIGAANPLLGGEPSVADRNYVMLNLQRTF
jgi:hypothetical protein